MKTCMHNKAIKNLIVKIFEKKKNGYESTRREANFYLIYNALFNFLFVVYCIDN